MERAPAERAGLDRPHYVVATRIAPAVVARLRERVRVSDVSELPRAAWNAALADATGLLAGSTTPVDAALLDAAPALKIVATYSVGYDNVDTAALAARGIALTNARGALVDAVADLTYGLVIIAMRRLGLAIDWVRSGRWCDGDMPYATDLAGATLGLVGFGAIAQAVVRRAHVSGMRSIYTQRTPREDDDATGASYRAFDVLLAQADCVVALLPLTAATRGMFDDAAFATMKPTAVFVNAARGGVCDTAALVRALERKTIAGAALDVTDPEPLPRDHPLLAFDNVVVTPHVGSATGETRARMAMLAVRNLLAYADGLPLLTPVAL